MSIANWLLLQVKPRQEMRALENLERQNAECYSGIFHGLNMSLLGVIL